MSEIKLIKGDITKIAADAIVNAANSSLMGGGGVDGAIHKAAGRQILEECKMIIAKQGSCPTGEAVITAAGKLAAHYVIHTVGPVWHGGKNNEEQQLANCYNNSLHLALANNCHTVAFPNISTGIYHFPKQMAAGIAVRTVSGFLTQHKKLKTVIFVCFDDVNYNLYEQLLQ